MKNTSLSEEMKEKVIDLAKKYRLSTNETETALSRSFQYFIDCGYKEAESWEKAQELVETAVYSARENGFDLLGMVNHFLFSHRHRSQNGIRRY